MIMKSPLGFAVATAAVFIALSPEARRTVRSFAVKGTETLLDINDQLKRGV